MLGEAMLREAMLREAMLREAMLREAMLGEAFDQNTKTRTQKKEVQCGLLPIANTNSRKKGECLPPEIHIARSAVFTSNQRINSALPERMVTKTPPSSSMVISPDSDSYACHPSQPYIAHNVPDFAF